MADPQCYSLVQSGSKVVSLEADASNPFDRGVVTLVASLKENRQDRTLWIMTGNSFNISELSIVLAGMHLVLKEQNKIVVQFDHDINVMQLLLYSKLRDPNGGSGRPTPRRSGTGQALC